MTQKPLIIYDFDGTLTPHAWTKFAILEKCGLEGGGSNPDFVHAVFETANNQDLDTYSALWQVYFDTLKQHGFSLTDENFALGANQLEYNPGVSTFLAKMQNHAVENIILSSSIKVFLDQTTVAPFFNDIFATTFAYDQNQQATGIDFLMNEKNKVTVIRQILTHHRGDAKDASSVVYVGDGLTDFYAMDYIKNHGGQSVFVYRDPADPNLAKLRAKHAVDFATPADYTAGSALDRFFDQNLLLNS